MALQIVHIRRKWIKKNLWNFQSLQFHYKPKIIFLRKEEIWAELTLGWNEMRFIFFGISLILQRPVWGQRKPISTSLTQGILTPPVGGKLVPMTPDVPTPCSHYLSSVLHIFPTTFHVLKLLCQVIEILCTEKSLVALPPRLDPTRWAICSGVLQQSGRRQ